MNLEVKTKEVTVGLLDIDYCHPSEVIDQIQNMLHCIPEEWKDSAEIIKQYDPNGDYLFAVRYVRPFTPEDLEAEKGVKDQQREWRRQQFETLKKEFGE